MARSSRRARPRPSVVVTFAATASLLACGGNVVGDDTGKDGGVDANPAGCPTTTPFPGSACEGSMACTYPGCDPSLTISFECHSGAWKQTSVSSCNPPMPTCPTIEPAVGSPCYEAPHPCPYHDACTDIAKADDIDYLLCTSGKWTLTDDYVATCPASAPADGDSCRCGLHAYPTTCSYSTGCSMGVGDAIATCDASTGRWSVVHATCNPPGPDGGPIDVGDPPPPDDGGFEVSPGDAGPGF
jgi:hypothetical protein